VEAAVTTLTVNDSGDTNVGGGGAGAGTSGDLRFILNSINLNPLPFGDSYDVVFALPPNNSIVLAGQLPIINLINTQPVTFNTTSSVTTTIDGSNIYPGLFAQQGSITLNNFIIQNTKAKGGNGANTVSSGIGGGGGMGAGAGLFINNANVVASDMTFVSNKKKKRKEKNKKFCDE